MDPYDLLIIGGGINGTAIARDAAIRGAKVLLVERDDLASHTSSASSKLIHGGLRYLEYGEFRLVREALREREILLKTAPHIVRPLRFILPQSRGMRPFWMLRAGLYLYDLFSLRGSLRHSRRVSAGEKAVRSPLADPRRRLLSYWDAWVDDSRLTVLNAVDAAENGAEILTRTELLSARRDGDLWTATLSGGRTVSAKAIVNAAGAWVGDVLGRLSAPSESRVRLVKGSHIVVPRLWESEHAYILQQPDGRVVFALPYLGDYTLIGTTDIPVESAENPAIEADERRYLCEAADRYFSRQLVPADIVWSYSGVRALHDDGAADAKAVTRDYHLELDEERRLLSVFGGKITTARALAEEALDRLGMDGRRSTGWTALPGGELGPAFLDWLGHVGAWMPQPLLARLSRAYGTRMRDIVGSATSLGELGRHHGAGLYEAELRYLKTHEFARTAEDVLWRRTKLGLAMSPADQKALAKRMRAQGPS
ncbi:MAG: glycerol-3-phosphate dehydrogenase [Alphaproteobacteria bacterium]|nr:MAG: glycerol-3-phosphate dehydrogenase [Alphaproteobacteria bacterium]